MQEAPILPNEKERLEAVHKMAILDTPPEHRFDAITHEATEKLYVSMSAITILDAEREWCKSCYGPVPKEGKRSESFCGHALMAKNIFFVQDTLKDPRFADNPMVVGPPFVRFYAGIALTDHKTGQKVGVFCVKDTRPRSFNLEETAIFLELAEKAEKELNK